MPRVRRGQSIITDIAKTENIKAESSIHFYTTKGFFAVFPTGSLAIILINF